MYEIIVEPPAERFIKQLKKEEQVKLIEIIDGLAEKPRLGKELLGRLAGFRSLRADASRDSYRVIYKIEDIKLLIIVVHTGYRRNIYSKRIGK